MRQTGFTLVELLIAIAVLVILIGAATPSLREQVDAHRRMDAAKQLASGIRSARVAAISRHQIVTIHAINGDWSNGWRIISDTDGKGPDDGDPILLERARDGKTPIVGNTKVEHYLSFDSIGGLRQRANGTLHVCASDQAVSHYRIRVSVTGRVRIEDSAQPHRLCVRTLKAAT